ncbi:autotransporter domain-containing protein [Achromobacter denitrificans]
MSHVYRLVGSRALGAWVLVSEIARGFGKPGCGRLFVPALFALTPAATAWAQGASWISPGIGDWSTSGNWNPGTPNAGESAYITNGGTAEIGGNTGVDLSGLSIGGVAGTSGNVIVQSGGSLSMSSSMDLGNTTGAASQLDINGGSVVQTGGSAWVFGNGTLVLRQGGSIDVSANGNGGALGLQGGTLIVGDGGGTINADAIWGTGPAAANHVVFDNDTGNNSFTTRIKDSVTVVHDGDGATTLTGNNTYTGGTHLNAGVLSVSQNANLGNGGGALNFNGGTLKTTANLSMNRATGIGAGGGAFDVGDGTTLTQAGVISGAGSLTKTGEGTLRLTGANTYTGGTAIRAGTLSIAADSHLGSTTGGLVLNGGALQATETFTLNAARSITLGIDGGSFEVAGGKTLSYGGVIADVPGHVGALTKTGDGTLALSGANSYTGNTRINGGALLLDGGSLDLGGNRTDVGATVGSNAALIIENGGKVSNKTGRIAYGANSTGVVTVKGGGSRWNNDAGDAGQTSLYVGYSGNGTLNIEDGGRVDSGSGRTVIGAFTGSAGFVTVTGAGSELNGGSALSLGHFGGDGTLTIQNGGKAAASKVIFDYGTLNLSAGGVLEAGWIEKTGMGAALNLNGGTLRAAAGASEFFTGLDAGDVSLAAGGLVFDTNGHDTGTALGLGGGGSAGGLTKAGTGTLTLSGVNAYTGATTINQGVLALSGSGSIASSSGVTLSNAGFDISGTSGGATVKALNGSGAVLLGGKTLTVDGAIDSSLASPSMITGTGGSLVKQGAGTLTLGGVSSYTGGTVVNGGTLRAGSANGLAANTAYIVNGGTLDLNGHGLAMSSLSGNGGTVALAAANLTLNQDADTAYAGAFSGTGSLLKTGTGVLILTGDSSAFTGDTTIGGGSQLVVGTAAGGALGGALTIASGGLLAGTGMIGSPGSTVRVAAGAIHTPGNSIGVQHIAGDYINRGTLRIEATPEAADRIVVAGSVDITGAALDLVLTPTDAPGWKAINGPMTIIDKQSAGAVTGSFDPVTKNLLFLEAALDYAGGDGNDVTLQLVRNGLTFGQVGVTRNQIAAGAAIDRLGSGNPLWRSIALTNDPNAVRESFDALSGEIHASMQTALIEDSRYVRNAANDRLRAALAAPGASSAPAAAHAGTDADSPVRVAGDHAGPVFWSQGFGSWGETDGDGNAARLDRESGGLLLGADRQFGRWRFGALAGYGHTRVKTPGRDASGSSRNIHLGAYAGTAWRNLALRAGAAYSWHELETGRNVAIPGYADSLSADYRAGTLQAFGELGYRIEAGNIRMEPFASLAHVRVRSSGYTEQGDSAALAGRAETNVTFSTLGLRQEYQIESGATQVTARGMLGWRHAFGDEAPGATQRFGGGEAFTVAGAPIARNSAVVEAGLDFRLTLNATLGMSYIGQIARDARDNGVKADLAVRF